MAGRSMFRQFDEDPFFADHRDHLRQMEDMFQSPFRGLGALEDGGGRRGGRDRGAAGASNELAPFSDFGFGNIFGNVSKMMEDMNRGFSEAVQRAGNGANGAAFHQASFMSYRNDGQGPPKVFQASTASKFGPGGVRETRKSLRDSERELEKMSIGHHIHDRGHEVEKHRNTRSGRTEELQNYHNLDEKDAEAFDQEWRNKTRTAFKGLEDVERRGGNLREIRDRRYEDEYPSDRDRRQSDRRERGGEKQLALPAPRAPTGNDARSPTGSEARGSEHWGRSRGRERS